MTISLRLSSNLNKKKYIFVQILHSFTVDTPKKSLSQETNYLGHSKKTIIAIYLKAMIASPIRDA